MFLLSQSTPVLVIPMSVQDSDVQVCCRHMVYWFLSLVLAFLGKGTQRGKPTLVTSCSAAFTFVPFVGVG